jgi:hypothetical protein
MKCTIKNKLCGCTQAVYGLGFIGAAIYYISKTDGGMAYKSI